jgi:hypothetical protein
MASGYSSAVLLASPLRSSRLLPHALGASFLLGMASCGGSSSETPPPLEPLPAKANVHYNRSATSLPGELGTPARPAGAASALPVDAPPANGH